MDINDKHEELVLKCISRAKDALAAGDKERALKFMRIASRLNTDLVVGELIEGWQKLETSVDANGASSSRNDEHLNSESDRDEDAFQVRHRRPQTQSQHLSSDDDRGPGDILLEIFFKTLKDTGITWEGIQKTGRDMLIHVLCMLFILQIILLVIAFLFGYLLYWLIIRIVG